MAVDPISLSASIITVANTGFSVGKFLLDRYSSYRNAPDEVLEIAHEVNICGTLMTPLGDKLKTGSVRYNVQFQRSVEGLISNSEKTFKKIRTLIPESGTLDKGFGSKWSFALNQRKIAYHRKRLRQVQQMFVFMKETMNEASSVRINTTAQNEAPITLAGTGVDGSGHAVEYIATLVARPLQSVSPPDARPPDGTQVRRDLGILRRSPYFSTDLLQDLQPDVKNMERPQPPRMKPQLPRMESPRAHDCSTDDPWDSHHLGLVSEEAAEKHVFALVEQWFGTPKQSQPTPDLSASSAYSPGQASEGGIDRDDAAPQRLYICKSCSDFIGLSGHHECRSCKDFDLCGRCFKGEAFRRLEHPHPKTHFVDVIEEDKALSY